MLAVDDLTHRYGDTTALDGVSLRVADGECVLLAGANGCGKTTLVRHLNGLLEPDEGEVRVNGTPVHDDLVAARASVGMVFQDPRDGFVGATVGADVAFGPENLGLPREDIDERVAEALDAVELADRRDERIDELSGGEQARVAVAGALAMRPDHLVLDEPFTGLDWPARQSVLDRLRGLHESGTSLVVVTHDLRDVWAFADRVVALADGEIAADGPPESVRDRLPDLGVRLP
ncbi:ABC-type transport system ATP-binding protein (probable substrate biotin) [Halobacterium hubeiense]|uniref:ABC-type transport system ATP-binding protein (Probable substrate biotin) n=1 Tax=Halobacterium hubeiense TaxID=1407499 RepID=A0A0U5H7D5_9EURY|nr:ABC transporter ATP-binding protein [Halobacterium hubeiense]CQH61854.1 ABC-type transport system ATP-binding protein (probable substrate biotin) [Halobacterium hubeiense]